jgi:hypothetical protein
MYGWKVAGLKGEDAMNGQMDTGCCPGQAWYGFRVAGGIEEEVGFGYQVIGGAGFDAYTISVFLRTLLHSFSPACAGLFIFSIHPIVESCLIHFHKIIYFTG